MDDPNLEILENALLDEHQHAVVAAVAGGVAHHFNNLLSGVVGLVSLAPTLDADAMGGLGERLKRQIDHASRLIRVVLSLTRRADSESAVQGCELVAQARDAVALAAVTAPASVRVESDLPDSEVLAHTSPVVAARLLLTLLTAAVRRVSDGEVRLTLRCADRDCEIVVTGTAPAPAATSVSEAAAAGDRVALGLLAAQRIAAAAGGRVDLGDPAGSLEWRACLPTLPLG
jgi:hypothetical protein